MMYQASKKLSWHASIIPKICIRIEHGIGMNVVDPISKILLEGGAGIVVLVV